MVKKVSWTPEAKSGFESIIDYLEENWGEQEAAAFVYATQKVIGYILEHPRIFRRTSRKNIHEALITSHNLMFYRVSSEVIEILLFWDTRQNPKGKRY